MARVRLVNDGRETREARVSPKGDPKPACEPRYNKGGAIAVVKSTEIVKFVVPLGQRFLSPSPLPLFSPPFVSRPVLSHEITWRETGPSPFLLADSPRRTRRLRDVHIRVCVSLLTGNLERFCFPLLLSLSLSLSAEGNLSCWNPAGSNETRHYEVYARISAE